MHSFQDHSENHHRDKENGHKCPNKDLFKTIHQKSGKSILSRPSTECAKMDPNPVLPRPLSLKMCIKRVLLRPLRMDLKMTLLSRPRPPLTGSRFNPIYVEPGSVSTESTRDLQALFPNSFDCIRDMKGEYDIKTDPTVPPVQHGRWKVPIEYKEEIEKELAEMVWQGIITKQTEPTPWVSSLTYPKKANGKLRICLDPKDLNKAIICENHKAPTLEEISHVLTGATRFSKVDGNKAFFGMHLSEEASLLTIFNTHLRRYRFLRVPLDSKCHRISSK